MSSNKLSSKEKLIDAAVYHLNTEGLNNFTATSLTRAANLGYGTFYKYFSSTEDVLEDAIKKRISDWSHLIAESNKSESDRLLAFMEAIYKTIIELSNNSSMRWLLEKPNYFVEVYFELTFPHAKKDVESAVKTNQISSDYLNNFETIFKLYLWQMCGALSMVDEGSNYKDIALTLIKLIIPYGTDEDKIEQICNLLEDRNSNKI